MPPLSADPIEDSFHRGRMSAAQAAAARLAARGTSAAKVKAGAAADAARDEQFQREMSAGGTQIDPATADRARRNHATLDQVGNADRSAIPAAVAGASDAVFGSVAPVMDAGGARYTNRGKGGLQYLSTLFGGAPPENPAPFSEAAAQIGDTIQQRGNETLGVDTSDPNVDLGQAITRLIAGTLTPVPIGHEMAREGGPEIQPSVLDRQPLDGSVLPPNTALQDHRTAQMARKIAAEQGWDISSIGRQRAGDDLRLQNVDARLGKEPDITPYELDNDSGVSEPPAPTQSIASMNVTRPADEPIPPTTLRQRGMRGRSGPVEQAESRGSSNGTPVPDDGLWYYNNIDHALNQWPGEKISANQLISHLDKHKGLEEAGELGLLDVTPGEVDQKATEKMRAKDPRAGEAKKPDTYAPSQWLKDHTDAKGNVSKTDLQKFMDENRVQVNEVWKGAALETQPKFGPDTHPDLSLPGGENYRELLLTKAPPTASPEAVAAAKAKYDDAFVAYNNAATHDEAQITRTALRRAEDEYTYLTNGTSSNDFHSTHWNEPNVLAHVRMNDRIIDGKKILHVEEVQSDWHQKGRKQGYDNPEARKQAYAAHAKTIDDKDAFLDEMVNKHSLPNDSYWRDMKSHLQENSDLHGADLNRANDIEAAEQAAREAHRNLQGGVPDAPFKGSGWKKLAMKRILKYAADNNYDGVTWTTGAQQAERYRLSNHVDHIKTWRGYADDAPRQIEIALKDSDGADTGSRLMLETDNKGIIKQGYAADAHHLTGKPLDDVVGKDVAEKIMGSGHDPIKLSGLDLDIGGEGMKGFYDKELPNITNDLLKKHGVRADKARILTRTPPAAYEALVKSGTDPSKIGAEVHHVDIPAKLKSSKLPLFAVGGAAALGAGAATDKADAQTVDPNDPIAQSFNRGKTAVKNVKLATTTSNDIKLAHPELQSKISSVISLFEHEHPGFKIKVNDVTRTAMDQMAAFKKGYSTVDGKNSVGKHNYNPSMAVDLNIRDASGGMPSKDVLHKLYTALGETAEEHGLRWGGRWSVPYDPYHFELPHRGPMSPPQARVHHTAEVGDAVQFTRSDGTVLSGKMAEVIDPSQLPDGSANGKPTYIIRVDSPRRPGQPLVVVPESQIKRKPAPSNAGNAAAGGR